ncbi:pyridoxamine 5'-phosphate oxidase family protein [Mucilaginibacter conchicola]|uniref:Pyridoxamine 5'-phosphate oxidase family protein n=1 Tax=Mucilaginibacter conchicola TaxID=2303333 RepID=A0A372NPY8_9SPHI|nr:pyridoxamine 5'-phosphate oxidase family protein [Mucilaginibacter conchicola]RFZ90999.1 pyridoxamine 5'-phosphate oxidase family protein [Mucilaginibacter conchicola]
MTSYGQLAFSDAAKALQEQFGSRRAYEQMEKRNVVDGLTDNEIGFINNQDHFYMASYGENGYPYIQHRGGPKGFVKVLNAQTLAFVDFAGNRQYISAGNIETNPNVSLIMISYPHRARLKLYAKTRIVELNEEPELFEQIDPADYKHHPERMMVLDVQAYDWNCPQHITPRYTGEEIEHAFAPQRKRLADLEAENAALKAELEKLKTEKK